MWVTRTYMVFKSVLQDSVPVSFYPHLIANSMTAASVSFLFFLLLLLFLPRLLLLPSPSSSPSPSPPLPYSCFKPKFPANQPRLFSLTSFSFWLLREGQGLVHSVMILYHLPQREACSPYCRPQDFLGHSGSLGPWN